MDTREWYSWNDLMSPKPDKFHITGEVYVSNPGIQAQLREKVPQGINPEILLLDLYLISQPGIWPQVMTWAQVNYEKILSPNSIKYKGVTIISEGKPIAQIDVNEIR